MCLCEFLWPLLAAGPSSSDLRLLSVIVVLKSVKSQSVRISVKTVSTYPDIGRSCQHKFPAASLVSGTLRWLNLNLEPRCRATLATFKTDVTGKVPNGYMDKEEPKGLRIHQREFTIKRLNRGIEGTAVEARAPSMSIAAGSTSTQHRYRFAQQHKNAEGKTGLRVEAQRVSGCGC